MTNITSSATLGGPELPKPKPKPKGRYMARSGSVFLVVNKTWTVIPNGSFNSQGEAERVAEQLNREKGL